MAFRKEKHIFLFGKFSFCRISITGAFMFFYYFYQISLKNLFQQSSINDELLVSQALFYSAEAVVRICSSKYMFLEISQIS